MQRLKNRSGSRLEGIGCRVVRKMKEKYLIIKYGRNREDNESI